MNRYRTYLDKRWAIAKVQTMITLLSSKDIFILALSLSLLAVGAYFLFDTANEWVNWKYDDVEHLSIAYNLINGKGLTSDFIDREASTQQTNVAALKKYDQISNPLRGKGPLYFMFLGAWLGLTNATYDNWYFLGSIFNFVLVASSIVIFFLYTKRYFGKEVAWFSAPILALMPGLLWFSVRLRPDVLAFIFIIASLYFGARGINIRNVVITAVFCSLAHLTHPLGILPGSAFIVYLLIKGKFKQTVIFLVTWLAIIAPWMGRNYVIFGDATRGLGLPIPTNMATLLGLATPGAVGLDAARVTIANSLAVLPLGTLVEMYNELTNVYGMQLFLIFISFSIVAYICFSSLKIVLTRKNIGFILGWVFVYAILIVRIATYEDSGLLPQFFVLYGVPLLGFIYIRFFSRHKNIFTTKNNSIYSILAIFSVITFTSYFLYGIKSGRIDVEPRLILYTLYLFIPLAIIGVKKILEVIFASINMFHYKRIVTLSLVCILIIFSFVQVSTGIPSINKFQEIRAEKDFQKNMHDWIIKNVPLNAKIASDFPHVILLRTGHEAVNFAHAYKDNPSYERWIIKKFDVDYLVFYYPKNRQTVILTTTNLGDIQLSLVYRSGSGSIYKISS